MQAKVSNLRKASRQKAGNSSSFVPNLPLRIGFDSSNQYKPRNQVGYFSDWLKDPRIRVWRNSISNKISRIGQEQASGLTKILENGLFTDAASLEEYMNQETLMQRLEAQLDKLHATYSSQQVDRSTTYSSKMEPSSGLLHAWSDGIVREPAFQKVAGPINSATDYYAVAVDNKYGFQEGGPSHPFIVQEPVFSPDNCSSISTCTDMVALPNFYFSGVGRNLEPSSNSNCPYFPQQQADNWNMDRIMYGNCSRTVQKNDSMAFINTMGQSLQSESNLYVSGGGRNLEASFKSNSSYFPQQLADNYLAWEMDPIKYGDCSRTVQKNESMAFINTKGQSLQSESSNLLTHQHVSREFSEVSNLSHGLSLGDLRHCQLQKLNFQQNLEHSVPPHVLHGKTYMAQSNSHFVNQGDHCHQFLGQKTLKQQQLFTLGSDGSAYMNSCNTSQVSVEERTFLEYLYYKKLNIAVTWDNSLIYLHSTVCSKGICNCEQYINLFKHFDACQSHDCCICYTWKSHGTDIPERHLDFQNSVIMGSVVRNSAPSGNSEPMPRTPKRRKMEPAFGVSLIKNASSDQLTHKIVQPCSPEAFSELLQQQKSPPSGNSEPMPRPPKRRKMEPAFGVSLINNACSDQLTMVQSCSPKAFLELQQEQESPPSCNSEPMPRPPTSNNASLDQLIHEMVQPCSPKAFSELQQEKESLPSGNSEPMPQPLTSNNASLDQLTHEMVQPCSPKAFSKLQQQQDSLPSGNSEPMPRPPRSNNASSDQLTPKIVQPCSPEAFSELQQEQQSPPFGNSETMPRPPQRRKMESAFCVSLINNASSDQLTHKMVQPCSPIAFSELQQQQESPPSSDVIECSVEQFTNPMFDLMSNNEIKNNVVDDTFEQILKNEIILSKDLEADHISGEPDSKGHDEEASGNFEVIELKADSEKETESLNPTVNTVSLIDFFTSNQIREHITSLRKQFNQSTKVEEPGNDVYKCQLCAMGTLSFAPEPIYCFCCGNRIKQNTYYYHKRDEDDAQHRFCTTCYRNSRGGNIAFNGTSVSKKDLDKKTNDREFEEAWVECDKCKSWQHSICALYNYKRDLDNRVVYTCPMCRLKEIGNGMHVPLLKTAIFGAKDLPRTMLSDHIERRIFKRLMQESEDWAKVEGNKNLDEVLLEENLSVRVVLSVNKQLKVKKEFLDIFEENYPDEFSYTSKVILLFQQIEGVDVCLFAMYVQEFGSECGYPNQRSVYISYLDSVKYFRPERQTMSGEALRTFVYHEILIGYLDICKKRGFTTCYIWACPPIKGEDYILYCHPDTQKTPKKDKLRHWYYSMLSKAAEENIVVGLTNIYDHFFVPTKNSDSKVTAARLPYFDGDFWSGAAMDKARSIEQESGGDCEGLLKKLVSKRTLKAMGHVNPPSKGVAKDILVMQKLGQAIFPSKEDFIVVQLQYVCIHCHEVIESGKRWLCTKCKNFQECERCHTADSHTSDNGEKHRLRQVLMDDVLCDTKETDIIIDNGVCCKYVYQRHWKCENCPEFTVCSACYNERGANCHAHMLTQTYSTAQCHSRNQELTQHSALIQELQDVIKHASQCPSSKTQPCTYPHCLQIKKLFSHASRCTIRVSGGCQHCKKVWVGLTVHSRDCRDLGCRIPRCMDLKKQAEWIATQSESRRRAAVLEDF